MLVTILLIAALILFGIPAVRALFRGTIDFLHTGLACVVASMLVPLL